VPESVPDANAEDAKPHNASNSTAARIVAGSRCSVATLLLWPYCLTATPFLRSTGVVESWTRPWRKPYMVSGGYGSHARVAQWSRDRRTTTEAGTSTSDRGRRARGETTSLAASSQRGRCGAPAVSV